MCAVATAYAGKRVISLGVNTPLKEMFHSVERGQAVALGVSVSKNFSKEVARELIADLDQNLPPETGLLVGGEGQPEAEGRIVTFKNWESYFLHVKNKI